MGRKKQDIARLPLPAVINPAARRCVTLSIPDEPTHIANFWGNLQKLAKSGSYDRDQAHTAIAVAAVWKQIAFDAYTTWIDRECGSTPETGDCFEFTPDSGLFSWYPANPFIDPNQVPTGYLLPPWHIVNTGDIGLLALGFQVGDLETDISRFPPGSLPTIIPPGGLPRFRFTFEGTADPDGVTVELHFVIVPAGGRVLIINDDNILNPPAETFDLNRDLLAIPPVTSIEVIVERKFTGIGTHVVESQWFPAVNDQVPFLYFGGGLRKVVVCGKDLGDVAAQFQVVDCVLQYRASPTMPWLSIFDVKPCIDTKITDRITDYLEDGTLGSRQPGEGGVAQPGFCKLYQVTLHANGMWVAPIPIEANYTISVRGVTGMTQDGTFNNFWRNGEGKRVVLGIVENQNLTDPSDPDPALRHQRLIMRYNGQVFDGYNVEHEVGAIAGAHELRLQINDSVLPDNSGDLQFEVEICNNQTFGLYNTDPAFNPNVSITHIVGKKWHVIIGAGNVGFVPYYAPLAYGRISPTPQTMLCVRWLFTNVTGWTDDPQEEGGVNTVNNTGCDDVFIGLQYLSPFTYSEGNCYKNFGPRSNTQMEFDVEIVEDCP